MVSGRGAVHAPGEALSGVEAQGAAHQGPGVAQGGEVLGLEGPGGWDGDLEDGHAVLGLRGAVLSVAQHPTPPRGVRDYQGGAALVQNSWERWSG